MADDPNPANTGKILGRDTPPEVLLKRLARALGFGDAADGTGGTYVSGGSTNTTSRGVVAVPSTAGGIQIVGTSAKPRVVSLINRGSTAVELFYGTTAGTAGNGFDVLPAGTYFETPVPTTSAISGLSASGTNNVAAVEYL